MVYGVCKLTGTFGKFVDSHLIPKALTKPVRQGVPFIQSGNGTRPGRRWSSWYDDQLVTKKGENILSELDNWAISEMRKHHLVWSGWGPALELPSQHEKIPGTSWGVRTVRGVDPDRFRLFLLSLLWRSAATSRKEFADIVLPESDVETLRDMLLRDDPKPISFYPSMVTQLSTIGEMHNLVPLARTKVVPAYEGAEERSIPTIRFYFDGLTICTHRYAADDGYAEKMGSAIVGAEEDLTVSTVTFEESFERENMIRLMFEAHRDWPAVMGKLVR